MNWLQQLLLPMLLSTGEAALLKMGRDAIASPNPLVAKAIIASIYPWIDGAVEEYVKTTPATWDDDAVDRVKRVCETLATEAGFVLPNIDAGSPND